MDKNTITGLVLIAAVLFGYSFWANRNAGKYAEEHPAEKVEDTKPKALQQTSLAETPSPTENADTASLFYASRQRNAQEAVILRNEKAEVLINPKGGQVARVNLKEYKSYQEYHAGGNAPLNLYNEKDARMNFVFETKEENLSTDDYFFTAENVSDTAVTMVLADPSGVRIAFDYELSDDYMLNMSVRTEGLKHLMPAKVRTFSLEWEDRVRQHEKGFYFENMYSTLTYKESDGNTEKLKEQGSEEETAEKDVRWIAFKNQYFSSCLISKSPLSGCKFYSTQLDEGSSYLKAYKAEAEVEFDTSGQKPTELQFYFGPTISASSSRWTASASRRTTSTCRTSYTWDGP